MSNQAPSSQKKVRVVPITPPPEAQRVRRPMRFAGSDEKKNRYHMPHKLKSASPVGFRRRVSFSREEVEEALKLLSLERPSAFITPERALLERELFEESALGVMSARQSTNFQGHRQITVGREDSQKIADILADMGAQNPAAPGYAPALKGAEYTHIILSRPYRTPFTMLLTFVGHRPLLSLLTVAGRALNKRFRYRDDIPSVGYLQQLHIGVLADAMERAALIASEGKRRAQVHSAPFAGENRKKHRRAIAKLEKIAGLSRAERAKGWRIALVTQVGAVKAAEQVNFSLGEDAQRALWRKLGANLLAFRSERIQPGVNAEESAPPAYQSRQDMRVPDELTVMAGRAGYNAFSHWSGCGRQKSKELLLLERIDVLTPTGKERLRAVRRSLAEVTDRVVESIPLWVDLPTGRAFSRNAERGRKAFALAGQRIYVGGLDREKVRAEGLDWAQAVRAIGAAAARSALVAELMGSTEIPEGCDLLAGTCLMAGPVNQNDIGKSFFGHKDLLHGQFRGQNPTSLLVWTLKAKTVADPIGNEEQLLNPARKGALVDLRPGPHQVVRVKRGARLHPMRQRGAQTNRERAFGDVKNFATSDTGQPIEGNAGAPWPSIWANKPVFE